MPVRTLPPGAPAPRPDGRGVLSGRRAGLIAAAVLALVAFACVATLPWTLRPVAQPGGGDVARYNAGSASAGRLPPSWVSASRPQRERLARQLTADDAAAVPRPGRSIADVIESPHPDELRTLRRLAPSYALGTDVLGRSMLARLLLGGAISLGVGLAAAAISVVVGTLYGTLAGFAGGRLDALMMRVVDVLYGLPYVLIVVLLAVAGGALVDDYVSREGPRRGFVRDSARALLRAEGQPASPAEVDALLESRPALRDTLETRALAEYPPRTLSEGVRTAIDLAVLLIAIGGTSWLTMARVVRAEVMSLRGRPFMDAARTIGVPPARMFRVHLLPNLAPTIIVYATLTVPQAILQESFLSFLGIGVRPPLPSWGSLAAEGLGELNPYESNWWLLAFPCAALAGVLVALNIAGDALRDALDPRGAAR
ncbi:MAG: ABC transporter permease [Planctomycetota bacterium]|nr:ABC transporter permease [Planctomycetota bacterium]